MKEAMTCLLYTSLDIISAQRDLPPDTASYLAACQERAGRIKQLTDELFRYSLLFSNDELPMRLETYDAYEMCIRDRPTKVMPSPAYWLMLYR